MIGHPLDDIAVYATDGLDRAERRAVERHLAGCRQCRDTLDGHHETLAQLVRPVPAPPQVWDRIRLATSPRRRPVRAVAALALAAAVAVVMGFALARSSDEPDVAHVIDEMVDVHGEQVGTVVARGESTYVLLDGLPPAPPDRAYQLWRLDGTEPVSLGLLSHAFPVALPTATTRLAITIEPPGGSSTPTGPIVARSAT